MVESHDPSEPLVLYMNRQDMYYDPDGAGAGAPLFSGSCSGSGSGWGSRMCGSRTDSICMMISYDVVVNDHAG